MDQSIYEATAQLCGAWLTARPAERAEALRRIRKLQASGYYGSDGENFLRGICVLLKRTPADADAEHPLVAALAETPADCRCGNWEPSTVYAVIDQGDI